MAPEQKALVMYATYQGYKEACLEFSLYQRPWIQLLVDTYGLDLLPLVLIDAEITQRIRVDAKDFFDYKTGQPEEKTERQSKFYSKQRLPLEILEEMYAMKIIPFRSDFDELRKLRFWAKEKGLI